MVNGFEIELSDGRVIKVVPGLGEVSCIVASGGTMIEIDVSQGTFVAKARKGWREESAVVRFERKDFEISSAIVADPNVASEFEILKACNNCNGKSCCITVGCINCGCGWSCDERSFREFSQ